MTGLQWFAFVILPAGIAALGWGVALWVGRRDGSSAEPRHKA
jgi:hypothetical protein